MNFAVRLYRVLWELDTLPPFVYYEFLLSFIDHTIQAYVGQKARENQWRVASSFRRVSSHCITVLATNTRNINIVAVLKQYSVLIEKEKRDDLSIQLATVSM